MGLFEALAFRTSRQCSCFPYIHLLIIIGFLSPFLIARRTIRFLLSLVVSLIGLELKEVARFRVAHDLERYLNAFDRC